MYNTQGRDDSSSVQVEIQYGPHQQTVNRLRNTSNWSMSIQILVTGNKRTLEDQFLVTTDNVPWQGSANHQLLDGMHK